MKFTKGERRHLKTLIVDCNIYGLSERDSLDYIRSRFGQTISPSYLYALKHEMESNEEIQGWINHFTRIGFLIEHKVRLEEMQKLQHEMFRLLARELRKPQIAPKGQPRQEPLVIVAISDGIVRINKRLAQLQGGTPILAQMKAAIEQGIHDTETEEVYDGELGKAIAAAREWEEEARRGRTNSEAI